MSSSAPEPSGSPAKGGKMKLLAGVAGVLVLLGGGGAGAWYMGLLDPYLGRPTAGAGERTAAGQGVLVDVPDIVANLNAGPRRQSFVRMRAKIEVARNEDAALARAAMPRVLDVFSTYLRETRPEELRGSAGNHRLREELLARANIVLRPIAVTDVVFVEFVVQ